MFFSRFVSLLRESSRGYGFGLGMGVTDGVMVVARDRGGGGRGGVVGIGVWVGVMDGALVGILSEYEYNFLSKKFKFVFEILNWLSFKSDMITDVTSDFKPKSIK